MLPLDHVPFYHPDPDALAEGFRRLGFAVSPPSRTTSPDHPGVVWEGRCVFLQSGWIDVIREAQARRPGAPAACLFLTPDLAKATAELADLEPRSPERLERRWAGEDGALPPETFVYAPLAARIASVPVAVIEHAWPCVDIRPEWFQHANGGEAIDGLIFGDGGPGPAGETAAARLDLSAFAYWSAERFDAAFPETPGRRALQIRVGDLDRTRAALASLGARFIEAEGGVAVPAQFGLACGLLFTA